jgi:hypothetical protein
MTISNVAAFRGLESCKKAEGLEEKLSHLKTMMKTKWYVADLPWPDIGNDKLRETNSSARDVFLRVIARTGIAWDFRAWDEADVPDFFGQTYWLLGDECYSSLEEGHFEKFKELFPIFFMMGLYAAEGFRGQIQRDSSRRNLIGFRDMFLDMMAISGYAAAHSEMQSVDYWDVVRSEWDKAIGETYGLSASYNLMKMAMELDKGFFGAMTARSIARTKWSQEFARFMRSSGLAVGYEDTLVGVGGSGSTNEFLRAIERTNSFHPNPEEFFVARLAVERDEMDSETLTPQPA